ncbi:MAG: SGNH/GDSL hydrolase family protein [Verrucomicrobiales bacterium]|nr:SGNH/GDSL hydrolase family protein [Verrucomicrobiales bacterium]
MAKAEEPEKVGLSLLSDAPFPHAGEWPDLPLTFADKGESFSFPVAEGLPYRIEGIVTTDVPLSGVVSCESGEIYYGKTTVLSVPATGGVAKHVALFFRAATGAISASVQFGPRGRETARLGSPRVRQATEAEYAAAYAAWRSQFPARDLSPRPGDGAQLSGFLSKLTDPVAPRQPLRVIGIGSSYTNMLGNGERLIQWIREHFPQAPPILYEKHVGSAVEFDFTRGWMRQHVLGRQPDLVILYSGGKAADLEKLLADFRSHSSADIIVASLHLREQDREITEATIDPPEWRAIREVARKYRCEWVDNRIEWAAYLREHRRDIPWLLKDAVHQSDHGALVINENICRHLVANPAPGASAEATPRSAAERLLRPGHEADGESVSGSLDGGGKVTVRFRGSRIDLVGRRSQAGGVLEPGAIQIDGVALDEVPAFVTTVIVPGAGNHRPERGSAADRSPHLVRLGEPAWLVPQRWTIRMHGDAGAYELIGSITGHDGYGHNGGDFTGRSGQITVPSELWRRRLEADGETYSNRDGDTFTWEVRRAVADRVDFAEGPEGEVFILPLADQLPRGVHTLEMGPLRGDGGEIIGFRVHEPPF